MSSKPIKITLFHADWCGHCINFMPHWESMRSDKQSMKNIKFEQYESKMIDSLTEKEKTINGNAIDGFPTIKITINDNEFQYIGDRSPKNIYSFVLKQLKGKEPSSDSSSLFSPVSETDEDIVQRGGIKNTHKNTVLERKIKDNELSIINNKK